MNSTIQTILINKVSLSQTNGKPLYSAIGEIQNYKGDLTPVSIESRQVMTPGTLVNVTGNVKLKKIEKIFIELSIWAQVVQIIGTNVSEPENLNQVSFVGKVNGDPDLKWFEGSGKCLCTTSLAVKTLASADNAGSDWFNLKIWGSQGESFRNICAKGSMVSIEGELDVESWTDKVTGEIRSRPIVKVDRWNILSTPNPEYSETDSYELPERGSLPQTVLDERRAAAELVDQIPF